MSRNQSFKQPVGSRGLPKTLAKSILVTGLLCGAWANADEPPVQSKHQMMKECMAKQKASEAGRLKEDMKKSCRDLINTEKQNADRAAATQAPAPRQ
jgi:hypothetical protein